MIIGVPKEIKNNENRVGLTEAGVAQFVNAGHEVRVQDGAGLGSGISDLDYVQAGAQMVPTIEDVYGHADMIIKVKEPQPAEYDLLQTGQILYAYLHLAAEPTLTDMLCQKKIKSIAYETIEAPDGSLPLLTPMSEVAGRMATQVGAQYLTKEHGGKGILLGGVTGVERGRVTILGGGVVGMNAAKIAVGMGADVTILDINRARLEYLDYTFQGRVQTLYSNARNIGAAVAGSDLVIGAVLLAGAKAPVLVTRKMVEAMAPGSVVVDVAVDQGGCIETCVPTSHAHPTFTVNGVIHYCVPNMPGVVARTSTYALTNATIRYGLMLANNGLEAATHVDSGLYKGLNTYDGHVTYEPVARALGRPYVLV